MIRSKHLVMPWYDRVLSFRRGIPFIHVWYNKVNIEKAALQENSMKKDRNTNEWPSNKDRKKREGRETAGQRGSGAGHLSRSGSAREKNPALGKSRDSLFFAGGRNSVTEALKSDLVKKLYVKAGKKDERLQGLLAMAGERQIPVEEKAEAQLSRMVPDLIHQGIVAEIKPYEYKDLDTVLSAWQGKDPFVILLDGLEDVRNLGAIIRSAECAGAAAVLLPEHRSCQVTYAAMKTAAGACAYLPVCRIGNIRQTLEHLKQEGFWVVGTDMDGESLYDEANLKGPLCIVMGAEGKGMTRLTREMCDFCVRIPMKGKVSSLNVSVAAALLMYEAARQRRS